MNITMHEVTSAQISSIGYDAPTQTLAVQFKGIGDAPGPVYHYTNIDTRMFEDFKKSESPGRFLRSTIKPFPDRYPYRKIEAKKEHQ